MAYEVVLKYTNLTQGFYFNKKTQLASLGFFVKIRGMKLMNEKSLNLLLKKPIFFAADARALGIHPSRLSYYVKKKLIERIGRGVYRGAQAVVDADFQWEDLIVISKSVPNGVVCLVSALVVYELTDEMPRMHWIAVPHATTAPKREHTRFIRMRDIRTGKKRFKLGNETISIFDQERTIIDAFRYLSKEVAIKALKEAVKSKQIKFDMNKFQRYAKKFNLDLDPYIITVTT
jgi:predicted transcriptional regulator of viral defense system